MISVRQISFMFGRIISILDQIISIMRAAFTMLGQTVPMWRRRIFIFFAAYSYVPPDHFYDPSSHCYATINRI
jgi:hypothetical protein